MQGYCDQVILIKPGTDGALALCMMNVMVKENLQDEQFLLEKAEGYEEFKETLKQYKESRVSHGAIRQIEKQPLKFLNK